MPISCPTRAHRRRGPAIRNCARPISFLYRWVQMTTPFDLNLRHLRALAAIVARGSMSAAAEVVSLSQPALTQGLAKLEAQLGAALFDRRADGMLPTEAGRALAAHRPGKMHERSFRPRGGARGFARPDRLMTATQ